MQTIKRIKIPKQIESLIKSRVSLVNEPYYFKIIGVSGAGYDMFTSAHITFNKIKEWAENQGSEVNLITDEYKNIYNNEVENRELFQKVSKKYQQKGQSKGYLIIEITDPVSHAIEDILNID